MSIHARAFLIALLGMAAGQRALAQQTRATTFVVRLPADARLYVDQTLCPLTGPTRIIQTPLLPTGRDYSYTFRAEGAAAASTRLVRFEAGEVRRIDFGNLEAADSTVERSVDKGPWVAPPGTRVESGPSVLPLPSGSPPQLTWAQLAEDGKQINVLLFEEVPTTYAVERKIKAPDGTTKSVMETRTKLACEPALLHMNVDGLNARNAGGKRVSAARLKELLKEPTPILYSGATLDIDAQYLLAFKPDTLVLQPTEESAPRQPAEAGALAGAELFVGFGPKKAPAGAFAFVKGPLPDVRLARVGGSGTLYLRDRNQHWLTMSDHGSDDPKTPKSGSDVKITTLTETIAELPASKYRAVDARGEALGLAQRLARERVVVICYEGQLADSKTLSVLQDDTPVLVLSMSRHLLAVLDYGHGTYAAPSASVPPAEAIPTPLPKKES
jgi:uncharacterized protein (TIGR03000 family)